MGSIVWRSYVITSSIVASIPYGAVGISVISDVPPEPGDGSGSSSAVGPSVATARVLLCEWASSSGDFGDLGSAFDDCLV